MKVLYSKDNTKTNGKFRVFLKDIISAFNSLCDGTAPKTPASKEDACSRLKLVLMHDRSKIAPGTLDKMKDELVDVISKYVDIDRDALDLNLESESNTIALIASIPIVRAKQQQDKPQEQNSQEQKPQQEKLQEQKSQQEKKPEELPV